MTTRPTPWVRVVIVNHNGGSLLGSVVAALTNQTLSDFEAVIVDNASTDGSIERLSLADERFRVTKAQVNLGFAAGCNRGAEGAGTRWLAMLNPDAIPSPDWLEKLRMASERHPAAALFGSTQLMADNPSLLDGGGDNYSIFGIAWRGGYGAPADQADRDIPVFSPCAAAALYRRDVFETQGGFAESFFCYLEDVDFGFRARLAGHRVIQVADAKVIHVGSALTGRHSHFTLFHSVRNGVFVLIRSMPLPLLCLSLPLYLASQVWLMLRTRGWRARLAGLSAGLTNSFKLRDERREISRSRRLSLIAVARLLVWNPRNVSRRLIFPLKR